MGPPQFVLFIKYYYLKKTEEDEMGRSFNTLGDGKHIPNFGRKVWREETTLKI
jgi:hypothetical protein